MRPNTVVTNVPSRMRKSPCYVFHHRRGYGVKYPTFDAAYEELSIDDSWLIVMADGSMGVHRPESRWDAEQVFAG